MTLRETILQADDIDDTTVTVPEWGDVKITLRGLTGKERVRLHDSVTGKAKVFVYADVLIATAGTRRQGSQCSTPQTVKRWLRNPASSWTVWCLRSSASPGWIRTRPRLRSSRTLSKVAPRASPKVGDDDG